MHLSYPFSQLFNSVHPEPESVSFHLKDVRNFDCICLVACLIGLLLLDSFTIWAFALSAVQVGSHGTVHELLNVFWWVQERSSCFKCLIALAI